VTLEPPPAGAGVPPVRHKLSEDLQALLERSRQRELCLAEIEEALRGRGIASVIFLLSLPFAFPIPNPTSSVFGIAVMLLSVRMIFGTRSLLPASILRKPIPHGLFDKVVRASASVFSKVEKIAKPRMHFLHRWPAMRAMIGAGVFACAFAMALPFIVPNMIPAIAILLLTLGMMEEDGVFVLAGYVLGAVSFGWIVAVMLLGREGLEALWRQIAG
jgi:hypothetical protein